MKKFSRIILTELLTLICLQANSFAIAPDSEFQPDLETPYDANRAQRELDERSPPKPYNGTVKQ